ESAALLFAIRSLQSLVRFCGVDTALDTVMIHGRKELSSQHDLASWQKELASQIAWLPGPRWDKQSVAFGLALGCLNQPHEGFDLARTFKPQASLRDIFPWGQVILQGVLLVCMALFLLYRSYSLQSDYDHVHGQNVQRPWLASVTESDLEKEKQDLSRKVEAVQKFLSSRIQWAAYTHDISERLARTTTLESFQGFCELEPMGKQKDAGLKPKKSLVLRGIAPLEKDGAIPKEIDAFLTSLRGH